MASPDRPPTERERQILDLRRQGQSHSQIASAVGCAKSTVCEALKRMGDVPMHCTGTDMEEVVGEDGQVWRERGDDAELNATTDQYIRSEEDAVREFKIDLARWQIVDFECKAWTVGMKVGDKEKGFKAVRQQQWAVRVKMKRRVTKAIEKALDIVFARFKDTAPKWPKVEKGRVNSEPLLAVFGACDVHFGKLAWAVETGENYDLKIAETVLRNAVEDLIADNRHRNIQRIVFPFGHDWMHVDSRALTTTRGTPQDVDGRFSKVLATAIKGAVDAVEMMAAVAPVQVELVPGNHDRTLSECIAHVISARFHHTDRVTVNCDPKSRKYIRFGTNLIGLTHGDMVKAEKLPNLMASDAKQDWADTTCHEWIIGHGHRSQKWTTQDTDTQNGVVIRMLRALTRTDLWHFDSGYCGQQPGAEVYLYGRDRGYAGHTVVPTRGG